MYGNSVLGKRKIPLRFIVTIGLMVLSAVQGCTSPEEKPPEYVLEKLSESEYPDFIDDIAYTGLIRGIDQSIDYLNRIPEDRKFTFGKDIYSATFLKRSLERFKNYIEKKPSTTALNHFIRTYYQVYRSIGRDGRGEVLYTGYFEPLLEGSLIKSERYPYPVYGKPTDMIVVDLSLFSPKYAGEKIIGRFTGTHFIPYYDRQDIEGKGALQGKARVLAWVDDRVDLFFLQIQGSGKIRLDNGKTISVGYHAKNGRPYRSIGQILIDEGKISVEEMSMQKIKDFFRQHPKEIDRILNSNPSYIFFTIRNDGGPYGALGRPLTAGRSVALDRQVFPLSALGYAKTQKPLIDGDGKIVEWIPLDRFIVAQDTGGAIKGPGRADLYWGNGNYAEIAAGHMKHTGTLYFLVMKPGG